MSSLTRRIQLRKMRAITDPEDPNYKAPRFESTRQNVGKPFRHVKYQGEPERPEKFGLHMTKLRRAVRWMVSKVTGRKEVAYTKSSSPNPTSAGGLFVPHHLLTLPRLYAPKRGPKRGWADGRK